MKKLHSMTGFGAASSEDEELSLRVELRSVNHRHFLLKARLPPELALLESEVERLLKGLVERGSFSLYLSATRSAGARAARVDLELAERYRGELEGLARRLGRPDGVTLDTLLGLPGVLQGREDGEPDAERTKKRVLTLVREATDRLVGMREEEGTALAADLRRNAAAMEKLVARIEKRMPRVVREHNASLKRRVEELLEHRQDVSSADVAREVALLADRLDVSEEVARLRSHLSQVEAILAQGGAVGRKLDFLVQEVFREVNTIGSKCNDAKVAHWVVEAKTLAERLREQVQNVE